MNTEKNSPILCRSLCGSLLLLALSGCGIFDFKSDDIVGMEKQMNKKAKGFVIGIIAFSAGFYFLLYVLPKLVRLLEQSQ